MDCYLRGCSGSEYLQGSIEISKAFLNDVGLQDQFEFVEVIMGCIEPLCLAGEDKAHGLDSELIGFIMRDFPVNS